MKLIPLAVIIICVVSIVYFMKHRETLEEKGFQVKQVIINCVLGIFAGIVLLIMLS